MTERTKHRDVMAPFDRWEGAGRDHRSPAIVIREQPSVYKDRFGCRFEVPANSVQKHWENECGRRWIGWELKYTVSQAMEKLKSVGFQVTQNRVSYIREIGVNPRYEEITRLGNRKYAWPLRVRSSRAIRVI